MPTILFKGHYFFFFFTKLEYFAAVLIHMRTNVISGENLFWFYSDTHQRSVCKDDSTRVACVAEYSLRATHFVSVTH